ncbi:MAG: phytanoyl-CoA dioxygenase family protein [Capsulimonadales bacterium]|nr:phytanoyl-CoA dioxygenase family protein [Capsulimonadales bacterium]
MPLRPRTTEEQAAFFHENGYVLLEEAVSSAYLDRLRTATETLTERKATDRNLLALSPVFEDLIDGHAGLPVLERLIGDDLQLLAMDLRTCPAGGGDMAWHTDHPYFSPVVNTVNCALYLDDLTPVNGALRVVPRSHRGPFTLTPDELFAPIPGEVTVECRAGTMVVFSDALWHRTGRNETDRPRRGIFVYYGHFWHKQCAYPERPRPLREMTEYIEGKGERRAQLMGLFRRGSEFNVVPEETR